MQRMSMDGRCPSLQGGIQSPVARRILNGESMCALTNEHTIKRSPLYRWRDAYRDKDAAGLRNYQSRFKNARWGWIRR
jgi:hypothetical protein